MLQVWQKIKNWAYKRALAPLLATPAAHRIINLIDAQTIGLIYNSTNPDNDIAITKFAEKLRSQGKTVEILGFVDDTKTDHKGDITVFNRKGVNWADVPTDERALRFAQKSFDLMLACYTERQAALDFLMRITKARWRVGMYDEQHTECFDMMINTGSNKDLSYLIEQTTSFLNKIHYAAK